MADESNRKTPIPIPHVFGQLPTLAQSEMSTNEAQTSAGVEQPSSDPSLASALAAQVPAPSTEAAAASPSAPPAGSAPQPTTTTSNAPSPGPGAAPATGRTGTPLRNTNGGQEANANSSSRAASQHPDSGFTMPAEAPPHGAPARQYLNTKVTGPLLEGMKMLVQEKPKDPLRVLGEYLIQRSKELESAST
ncbi:hypothetical protein F4805DRAFT_460852 [Annulohypoxylon moriforme]|nr:hypothetical protein F4805DRAFT_460852 [Annulohypoxylon moriforme]